MNIFADGFLKRNSVFRMTLGICASLAITGNVRNAIAMSLGVMFVTVCTSTSISAMRVIIPSGVRLLVSLMVIATFTTIVDLVLRAYYPAISEALGPYVGLIVTNCLIMGRAETFAIRNPVGLSIVDAFGTSCGYAFALLLISGVRELLGYGTLLGHTVLGTWWTPWAVIAMPPGAFFVLGLTIWAMRAIVKEN
jgi:Na+-transporting NADH:ubiquinone oxidoreductase subunit D